MQVNSKHSESQELETVVQALEGEPQKIHIVENFGATWENSLALLASVTSFPLRSNPAELDRRWIKLQQE